VCKCVMCVCLCAYVYACVCTIIYRLVNLKAKESAHEMRVVGKTAVKRMIRLHTAWKALPAEHYDNLIINRSFRCWYRRNWDRKLTLDSESKFPRDWQWNNSDWKTLRIIRGARATIFFYSVNGFHTSQNKLVGNNIGALKTNYFDCFSRVWSLSVCLVLFFFKFIFYHYSKVTELEQCNGCIIKRNQRPQRLQFNIKAHRMRCIYIRTRIYTCVYARPGKLQTFPSGPDRDW
jgi:hypothetical protein